MTFLSKPKCNNRIFSDLPDNRQPYRKDQQSDSIPPLPPTSPEGLIQGSNPFNTTSGKTNNPIEGHLLVSNTYFSNPWNNIQKLVKLESFVNILPFFK